MNQSNGIIVDPEIAAQRANVLLESEIQSRIGAVRLLAQRQNALDEATAEYETAWQSASRVGWSEDKLRDIGLRSPETSPAPAGRRSSTSTEQPPASSSAAPAASIPQVVQTPVAPAASTSAPIPTFAPVVHLAPPTLATPPTLAASFPETVDSAR
ncbi:MAG: hypothetical protein ACHP7F_07230 [Actinomycetales bacterium]